MKLLVVEDELRIAYSLKKGLEQENYTVELAHNGVDGFDLASTGQFDLIVLDLMLPKKDGLTICKDLRKEGIKTPILMLTAKSDLDEKILGLDSGADDYVTKPFALEEFLARIRALLRRPQTLEDSLIKCGSLVINPISYEISRAGKELTLSKKEFSLLEFMVRNKGKILTKEKIMDHVWEYDSEILPNTVEQYVGYLRTKIDKNFPKEKQLIHTVRGFGYKIVE